MHNQNAVYAPLTVMTSNVCGLRHAFNVGVRIGFRLALASKELGNTL